MTPFVGKRLVIDRRSIFLVIVPTLLFLGVTSVDLAWGQAKFQGTELSSAPEFFIVRKDASIRAKPATESPRVGRFPKGARISVAGRAKGTQWFAVRKDGSPVGFVYGSILSPLIDGRLDKPVIGKLSANGKPSCDYTIQFEGKTKTEGELLETSDYAIRYRCRAPANSQSEVPSTFSANMFITELPYRLSNKAIYQISLDLFDVPDAEDGEVSVTVLYDASKGQVAFDRIAGIEASSPKPKKKPRQEAGSVIAALIGAVNLSYNAWTPELLIGLSKPIDP